MVARERTKERERERLSERAGESWRTTRRSPLSVSWPQTAFVPFVYWFSTAVGKTDPPHCLFIRLSLFVLFLCLCCSFASCC